MLTTKVLCHEILAAENILLLHYNYFGTVWLALRLLVLKQIQLKTTAVNLLDIFFFFIHIKTPQNVSLLHLGHLHMPSAQ